MKNPEKLLDLLAQDARPDSGTAGRDARRKQGRLPRSRPTRRIQTILGYKTVVDWDKTSKESVTALIEVKITPQKGMGFDEIARQIYSHHQVESVYLMSGGFDLTVIIKGRTMREVARFCLRAAGADGNVLSTGTHFILKNTRTTVWNSTRQTAIERGHGMVNYEQILSARVKEGAAFRHSPLF